MWRAQIIDAGRFYLDNGIHPDHPDRLLSGAAAPRQRARIVNATKRGESASAKSGADGALTAAGSARTPAAATVEQARQLVERLQAEGGTVRGESPDSEERALYRRVIHAAKQHALVPAGFHLKHTGRAAGDLIIRLSNDDDPDETEWNRIRLNTRRVTTDPDLVFTALEKNSAGLEVTKASVPRALDLIRGLAAEARRRGHRVGVNTKTKNPSVYLQVDKTRRRVRLIEEYDEIPTSPPSRRPGSYGATGGVWTPRPTGSPPAGSGWIARAGWDKKDTWTDDKRTTLEKRLPRIIRDVEAGIAPDEEVKPAAQRAHDERVAELNRREAEERRRWQAAIDEARPQAAELLRKKAFRRAEHRTRQPSASTPPPARSAAWNWARAASSSPIWPSCSTSTAYQASRPNRCATWPAPAANAAGGAATATRFPTGYASTSTWKPTPTRSAGTNPK